MDFFSLVIENLKANDVIFIAEPIDTDFGFMAIIEGPDGRKIELYKD